MVAISKLCAIMIVLAAALIPIGDALPSSCKTMAKHLEHMNPFKKKTKGEIFCPLRAEPLARLQRELERVAGQESALVSQKRSASIVLRLTKNRG